MVQDPASEWIADVVRPHCNDKETEWPPGKDILPPDPLCSGTRWIFCVDYKGIYGTRKSGGKRSWSIWGIFNILCKENQFICAAIRYEQSETNRSAPSYYPR